MDPDWVAKVRKFERVLALVRGEFECPTTCTRLEALADVLRLMPDEQYQYRELVREASSVPPETGSLPRWAPRPFLDSEENRVLFLACDYTVWGVRPFVLRSLLRQALLELRTLRSLPPRDDRPFAYASLVRSQLSEMTARQSA